MLARKNEVYVGFDGKRRTVKEVTDNLVTFDDGLTVKSLGAFKLVEKAPVEIVEAEVYAGKLKVGGNDIETGTLNIIKVISNKVPGKLLLTVESLEKGYVDLFEYDVEEDRFENILKGVSFVEEVHDFAEGTVFVVNKVVTTEAEFLEDENTILKPVEDFENQLVVYGNVHMHISAKLEVLGELLATEDRDDLSYLIFKSQEQLCSVEDVYGNIYNARETKKEGSVITQVIIKKYKNEDEEEMLPFFEDLDINVFDIKEELLKVQTTYFNNDSLLLITKEGIIFTNNGFSPRHAKGEDVVETALEFPHFVKLKPGTKHNEFVLANKKGDVATIKVTKTDDRGYVTEIIR